MAISATHQTATCMIGTARPVLGRRRPMDEAGARRPRPVADKIAPPATAESTIDLVLRARAGDQSATAELFDRYGARLRRWAHGRLPAAARGALESQDLVQETLIKVFQRLPMFEPHHPGAFRDYVWTTLWNCIRDIARTYHRRGPSESLEGDLVAITASPLEEAMGREVFERYEAAMERLRPEEREAIIARIELGLSHAEVAAAVGKSSAAAAHMAVSRALMRLAEEMAHDRKPAR
jgi:RNA polymerase sigma-70 factor, ECF subfamily